MNSRECLLTTLRHEEPDHIPIDLDSMAASSIAAMAYNALKGYLGIQSGATRIWDPHQLLAMPEEGVLQRFRIDTRPVRLPIAGLDLANHDWVSWQLPDGSSGFIPAGLNPQVDERGGWFLTDSTGQITHRLPKDGFYFDQIYYPLADASSITEIDAFQLTNFSTQELNWMGETAKRLYHTTDKAIVTRFRGTIMEGACALRGWEQFMMDLLLAPKMAQAVVEKLTNHYLENLPAYLAKVAPYAQVIVFGDDLGNQKDSFFSVDIYRKFFKPYHRKMIEAIKSKSDLFVFLHSDGNIRKLIPDLIEIGFDILNPVQFTARDMDPVALKRDFGNDIVFWGAGADTQHVLPNGSPGQVRYHVKEMIDIMAPGGGFVFNQVHNLQANVPPENIVTMFDTAYEYGFYQGVRACE